MEPAPLTNQREEPPITGKAFELMRAATFTLMPLTSPPRHLSRLRVGPNRDTMRASFGEFAFP
jgi:hypothetical protein